MTISRGYKTRFYSALVWAALALSALACITPSVASQPNRFDGVVTETREALPTFPIGGVVPSATVLATSSVLSTTVTPDIASGEATAIPQAVQAGQTLTAMPTPSPYFTFTPEPDRVWDVRPLGTEKITIRFYTGDRGMRCVGITKSPPEATNYPMITNCAQASQTTLVAVKATLTDTKNNQFTVVAGHIFDPRIVVVSLEFRGGDNTPAEITDGGFVDITPGLRIPLAVVPIDQYGNLVGNRFVFAP